MKFSPETVRGSCHGKCREISGEILLLFFLRRRSSKAPRIFHDEFHATFHETFCSCKCPISWHFSLCRLLSLKNTPTVMQRYVCNSYCCNGNAFEKKGVSLRPLANTRKQETRSGGDLSEGPIMPQVWTRGHDASQKTTRPFC